ncbi:MAG TPA: amidase [Acidimicrobiales bacterium]|nr:amidase [Acidimicrobiales bacterium]
MSELHDLSALEQAAAIRRRDVSPRQLVDHYLERIAAHDPAVGAFVTVTADRARDQAARAEARLLEGGPLPPLFGVPTAIKDLNLTAAVPTKFGSAVMADFVPPVDDHVVTLLSDAGLISLGKTNTPEFGLPCYTEPDVAPPARTPFALHRSAGGSSGGAGAAVSAGLVPFAQGSDGAGSIRIPASVCGLVGLKTSRGRVSGGPVMADVAGLAVNGPLARTVGDAAALLDAMARVMPGDPYWAPPLPAGETFLAATRVPVGRLRIGRYIDPVIADAEIDDACVTAFEETSALLEELGHDVEDCPRPFQPDLVGTFETIWTVGAATIPVPEARELELRPLTQWLRERGRCVSGKQAVEALATAQLAARRAIVATAGYDAVLTPTLAQPPALVGGLRDDARPDRDFDAQKRFTPFTAPANVTGQPAISLPLHWTPDGLPIGVQLIGRPAGEASLLSLAAQLEEARPWRGRLPSCW